MSWAANQDYISISTPYKAEIEKSKMLLVKKTVIEFPQYNFEVELYCNDVSDALLARAKQEIINTVYDFKEAFGLKESPIITDYIKRTYPKNPDITRKLRFFLYDSSEDIVKSLALPKEDPRYSYGYAEMVHDGIYVSNAYLYKDYMCSFCHEFAHQLAGYVFGSHYIDRVFTESIADYVMWQSPTMNRWQDKEILSDENLNKMKNSELDVNQEYGIGPYILMTFFEEKYSDVIDYILHHAKNDSNALTSLKNKYPHLADYIDDEPSANCDDASCYTNGYGWKFIRRISKDSKVKKELQDFIESKIKENKYIETVNALNAFRVVKGDHIGTDKKTNEEYYQGIIIDNKYELVTYPQVQYYTKHEIGSFSPMEYSYDRGGIIVFNYATKDSVIIPKEYHHLKPVKVNGNYKLAFCDQNGNEYRDTYEYHDKVKDFLYTDHAEDVFALIDSHAIKLVKNLDLNKIFSIKLTNSLLFPMRIYDDNKNVGLFTNEVGYVNRKKFYFKNSSESKVYNENRALVAITEENDKYISSLRDGNSINDQSKSIKLNGNYIDSYSRNRETGDVYEQKSISLLDESYATAPIDEINRMDESDQKNESYKKSNYNDSDEEMLSDQYGNADMSYQIIKGNLHIKNNKYVKDGENNTDVKLPKSFKFLKPIKDDIKGCIFKIYNEKGHALPDKYSEEYKYIKKEFVKLNQGNCHDYTKHTFLMKPDQDNSEVVKIFDLEEIGELGYNFIG